MKHVSTQNAQFLNRPYSSLEPKCLPGCLFEIVSLRTVLLYLQSIATALSCHSEWCFSIKISCLLCLFYGKLCEALQCIYVKAFPTEQVYKYTMLCKTSVRGNPPLLLLSEALHVIGHRKFYILNVLGVWLALLGMCSKYFFSNKRAIMWAHSEPKYKLTCKIVLLYLLHICEAVNWLRDLLLEVKLSYTVPFRCAWGPEWSREAPRTGDTVPSGRTPLGCIAAL